MPGDLLPSIDKALSSQIVKTSKSKTENSEGYNYAYNFANLSSLGPKGPKNGNLVKI